VGGTLAEELAKCASVAIFGPNCLVLRFSAGYNRLKERLQQPGPSERLEQALRKVTGQPVTVRYEVVTSGDASPAPTSEPPVPAAKQTRAAALQNSLVKAAMDALGAQLLRADEGFGTAPATSRTPTEREGSTDDV
jgi:hypothetical protein